MDIGKILFTLSYVEYKQFDLIILAFILDNQLDNAKTANSILPEFHLRLL